MSGKLLYIFINISPAALAEEDTTTEPQPQPTGFVARSPHNIIINSVQRGNPLLKHIRNVPYEFGDIRSDFLLGQTTCAFFLSLRYHAMHPHYLLGRVLEVNRMFRLRVLLVLVDLTDNQDALEALAKFCVVHNLSLLLAWSNDEAARYLETLKSYEHKSADQLQEHVAKDYISQLTSVLTTVKSVNKTDVVTLSSTFGCLKDIANVGVDDLRLCPGIGDLKAERLMAMLDEPFVKGKRV